MTESWATKQWQDLASKLNIDLQTVAIASFRPRAHEVPLDPLNSVLLNSGHNLVFPRIVDVENARMEYFEARDLNVDFKQGTFKIMEPVSAQLILPSQIGIFLVPGIAFDRNLNRRGHGKGYYDRYLAKNTKAIKVGFAFDSQMLDKIETNPWDIAMDYLITEKEVIHKPSL